MTTLYTFPKDVHEAALLLDEVEQGWEYNIDLYSLDMGSCYHCVLGQIYGEYSKGLNNLFFQEVANELLFKCTTRFNPFAASYQNYLDWVEQIKVRLNDKSATV
jgi:hypothetical protein